MPPLTRKMCLIVSVILMCFSGSAWYLATHGVPVISTSCSLAALRHLTISVPIKQRAGKVVRWLIAELTKVSMLKAGWLLYITVQNRNAGNIVSEMLTVSKVTKVFLSGRII